jgi:PAS domain S-box-containing protein
MATLQQGEPATPETATGFQKLHWVDLIDALPLAACACDRDGKLVHANGEAQALLGALKPGVVLREILKLSPEDDPCAEAIAQGRSVPPRPVHSEHPGARQVEASARPLTDAAGNLIGALVCLQSMPRNVGAAPEPASLRSLHEILQALPVAIYTTDIDGNITFFNEAAAEFAGCPPEPGQKWCVTGKLYAPNGEPLPAEECSLAVTLRERRPVRGQAAIAERPDGTRVPFMPYPTPLVDAEGTMVGAINMLVDLSASYDADRQHGFLASIVSSSDDAIVSKTLDGIITSWNTGATRIFGYEPQEMIGQSILRLIPPELQGEEAEILAKLRRGERLEHFDTVRVAKDGRRIDVSLTVSPVRDRDGHLIGASKVGRDVTRRKQAEKIQALLVGELNHRVKNTLATMQAIANQTVRTARSPAEFAQSFNGRLQALARIHTLLTSNAWQGAEVAQIIRDQLSVRDAPDARIELAGPSAVLDPQTALRLALVLHELATNAYKHGALSAPGGDLLVRWAVDTNGGRHLLLEWRESGGPLVRAPTSRGFGTTLIEQSLRAYGGNAAMRYEAHGVGCKISLPIGDDGARTGPVGKTPGEVGSASESIPSMPRSSCAAIAGRRVLVVEDEPLVAMDIVSVLREAGCEVVGPAATCQSARALIDAGGFDVALLDANLGGDPVDDVALALTQAGIPFAFVTGYSRDGLPQAFRHAPMLGKPSKPDVVVGVVAKLVAQQQGGSNSQLQQAAV